MEQNDRPAPEAFLTEAHKEGRGKLKIFLGAAPGVGKTYAMLRAAQLRKQEGHDVAIGIVETHGRRETEDMVHDLEVLPRLNLTYRDKSFTEMDIDALIRRKPEIALVDELAHTNIEGARHIKRYQDVEELLAAGINVYTTLNIQHLESVNDIVQRITWVKIRETLPDSVLKTAEEIELVDLPPEDLIQRLHEGKVYMPDQAQMAVQHYFQRGNLTALRELAMRTAAEHVDSDMLGYMRTHGVKGPWPARERFIVCVDESGNASDLIRMASRIAARDRDMLPWIALHVEGGQDYLHTEGEKDNIEKSLRLAEELGAEAVTIRGSFSIADDILAFARSRNATRILIGRSGKSPLVNLLFPPVSHQLIMKSRDFDIMLLHATKQDKNESTIIRHLTAVSGKTSVREFAATTIAVLMAFGVSWIVNKFLPLPNLSLVFLMPVLFAGVRFGLWPSLYAAILGVSVYNFFFTAPYFTFNVLSTSNLTTLIFYLFVAVVTGNMAVRLKNQVEALRFSARRNAQMHDFTRKLASALTLDDILRETVLSISIDLDVRTAVVLPEATEDAKLHVASCYPATRCELSITDWGAAEWAWKNSKPAGAGSDTLPAAGWYFIPLKGPKGVVALLGTAAPKDFKGEEFFLSPAHKRMLYSFSDQAVLAIERAQLSEDIEEARILAETEKLRSALLSSISHDLRTPLASIIGSAMTLQDVGKNLPPQAHEDLLKNVLDEAERLNRFIQNLLDMTELGHGKMKPKQVWVEFRDILGRSLKRAEKETKRYKIEIDSKPSFSTLFVDPVLMEQVFVNILDNAAKYALPDSRIKISFLKKNNKAVIIFADEGPGIPEQARERVFDMFYRVRSTDAKVAGTGLGLAICRGLVEAHGGQIRADIGLDGKGTSIVIEFPVSMAGGALSARAMKAEKHG
jgi:two-component system sensor histidine kinase KdpD